MAGPDEQELNGPKIEIGVVKPLGTFSPEEDDAREYNKMLLYDWDPDTKSIKVIGEALIPKGIPRNDPSVVKLAIASGAEHCNFEGYDPRTGKFIHQIGEIYPNAMILELPGQTYKGEQKIVTAKDREVYIRNRFDQVVRLRNQGEQAATENRIILPNTDHRTSTELRAIGRRPTARIIQPTSVPSKS